CASTALPTRLVQPATVNALRQSLRLIPFFSFIFSSLPPYPAPSEGSPAGNRFREFAIGILPQSFPRVPSAVRNSSLFPPDSCRLFFRVANLVASLRVLPDAPHFPMAPETGAMVGGRKTCPARIGTRGGTGMAFLACPGRS